MTSKNASQQARYGRAANLLLVVAGVVMALAVAELALRARHWWAARRALRQMAEASAPETIDTPAGVLGPGVRMSKHPRLVYELRPNLRGTYDGRRFRTNRLGLRHDSEFAIDKPDGVERIVGIGDSWMWGSGVDNGETYLDRLAELLTAEGRRVEVINTAVWGYNVTQQVSALEHKGLAFGPDVVVVGLCGNDREYPAFLEQVAWVEPTRSLLWNEVAGRLGWTSRPAPAAGAFMPFSELEAAYARLAELARRAGFQVLVFSDCFAGEARPRQSPHCNLATSEEWARLMARFDEWHLRRCAWRIEDVPQNGLPWGHASAEGNRKLATILATCLRPLLEQAP